MSFGGRYQITGYNARIEEIADWLLCNPGKGQKGRCAAAFNISQAWLSTLINTDAFRAVMARKQGILFEEVVIPMKEKLYGVADASIDRLGEIVEQTTDERLVKDIAKDTLSALGYSAQGASGGAAGNTVINNHTQNNITVNSDALAAARARRTEHYTQEAQLEDSNKAPQLERPLETPSVSADPEFGMGETRDVRSKDIHFSEKVHRAEEEGGDV